MSTFNWYTNNIRKININYGTKLSILQWVTHINGIVLLFVFFTIRIVFGISFRFALTKQSWLARYDIPLIPVTILIADLFILGCPNIFWFTKMVKIARTMSNLSQKSSKEPLPTDNMLSEKSKTREPSPMDENNS